MAETKTTQTSNPSMATVRTPLWRRLTALFTLSSLVVVAGLILALVITLAILMVLYLLEQAIA